MVNLRCSRFQYRQPESLRLYTTSAKSSVTGSKHTYEIDPKSAKDSSPAYHIFMFPQILDYVLLQEHAWCNLQRNIARRIKAQLSRNETFDTRFDHGFGDGELVT